MVRIVIVETLDGWVNMRKALKLICFDIERKVHAGKFWDLERLTSLSYGGR